MVSSEWSRELKLLADPRMQAWVERAANRMVGELLSEGRFPRATPPEGDLEFTDRLVRCELAMIADGAYPLRVALGVATLRVAREVVQAHAAIQALPESVESPLYEPQPAAVIARRRHG